MITKHTQLLNYLIDRYALKNYLEIGINNPDNNYHKINLPLQNKVGVDPCLSGVKDNLLPIESDTFFKSQTDKFDLIFVDGLHHADQVRKDFENSLRCLNDGGFIVIHDTLPDEESTTHVPRDSKMWHGDVYKMAMNMYRYLNIGYITLNADCGCMIVWKINGHDKTPSTFIDFTFEQYIEVRKHQMNIVEPAQLMERLPVRVKEPVA